MDIGRPQRIIEIEPVSLPVPGPSEPTFPGEPSFPGDPFAEPMVEPVEPDARPAPAEPMPADPAPAEPSGTVG
jgi:hypothetical protein